MLTIYVKIEILKSEFIRLLRLNVLFFIAAILIIPVTVNRIIKYFSLIDTDAELNIIIIT